MRTLPHGLLLVGSMVLVHGSGTAQTLSLSATADVAVIDSVIRANLDRASTPGFQVAVRRNGVTIFNRGYGWARLTDSVRVTPTSVFPIGSITKEFTSAATLGLVRQGAMMLDDSVAPYFSGYRIDSRVTLRNLLNHTSGLRAYERLIPNVASFARTPVSADTVLFYLSGIPLDFDPGHRWAYSNTGFHLLGLLLERRTGIGYFPYVESRLATPLHLDHTGDCERFASVRARGYEVEDRGPEEVPLPRTAFSFAAGGLCSTAADLVVWQEHFASVIGAGSPSIRAGTVTAEGDTTDYGYGVVFGSLGGHPWFGHGGSIPGFDSYVASFPDDRLTIAIIANARPFNSESLQKRIARALLGIVSEPVRDVELAAAERVAMVGSYRMREGGALRIEASGERLRLRGPGDFQLMYQGGGVFLALEEPEIRIEMVRRGERITGLIYTAPGRRYEMQKEP